MPGTARSRTVAGMIAATAIFALLAYHRRWISDDGLIVVRTVRQILDGHGPVFNGFERAEANTSTLWTYLLVVVIGLTRGDPTITTVVTGWVLSVAGLAIAMDATRRWHLARGSDATLVPAGALVVLAAFPFWDYATSGLETGLSMCWIATSWWLLVATRRPFVMAIVFGLGPLVRPDLALVSAVFLVAAWFLVRPSRKQTFALAAAAIALPLAYEIFRAGYYGTLVPLPALAKGATGARWERGVLYVWDYVKPYLVWLPAGVLVAQVVVMRKRIALATRDRWLVAAPIAGAMLLLLYVVRVGGDFMHARMCLPPTFMVLLPAMLLPLRRVSTPAIAVLALWALAIGILRGNGRSYASAMRVEDEHYGYVRWTKDPHPITAQAFIDADRPPSTEVENAVRDHRRVLVSEGGVIVPLAPTHDGPVAFAVGRLGCGGAVVPLDGIVVDTFGLANPLGSRITATNPAYPGHEKSLPWSWILADFADPSIDAQGIAGTTAEAIRAARHAMTCGDLAELLASVREPMTAARFWDNLTGAVSRTRLEIPSDPIEAEKKFCR